MAAAAAAVTTTTPLVYSTSSSSSSSLLVLLGQVLFMPAASSDFKAAAGGAIFGAGAALLVSHLLLELTFSSVFSTFFAVLFFLLSLLVLQRAFTIRAALSPSALLPEEQEQKPQHQHWPSAAPHGFFETTRAAVSTTAKDEKEGEGGTEVASPNVTNRGDVEEIYLEEDREDTESARLLLQQEHVQQECRRFQNEQQQMRRLLFGLAAMLAGSALVAGVVDTRKFQTFHWLLKMSFYILLSNSLCFLLVFAAVDVINFYYDIAYLKRKMGGSCGREAATPDALGPPLHLLSSNHYPYTALSTSAQPLSFHSPLTNIPYIPINDASAYSFVTPSVALAAAARNDFGVAATDSMIPSPASNLSHGFFASPNGLRAGLSVSSADSLATGTPCGLPVHTTLQVYVLLGGSLLLGTSFGFFYGMFRFEASPYNSVQLIRSRYVCVPLAAVIGPLAGVLVKRIGDLSNAAAAAATCMLQQQHEPFDTVPYSRPSALGNACYHQPTGAATTPLPYATAPTTATGSVAADISQGTQPQQLFTMSTAAGNFIEVDEEEEAEENLLTFSAAEHRQLLSLA